MRERLRPKPKEPEFYGFYCKVRDLREIQLIREASAGLGWPQNSALLHLLADHYIKTTSGKVIL
jgi:hypothetical protein